MHSEYRNIKSTLNNINIPADNVAVIILAAGMGKRMKSDKAKVLHEILGKSMVLYVIETAMQIAGKNIILIIGHQSETVRKTVSMHHDIIFTLQEKQLGTGHAVLCALPDIPEYIEQTVILCGDVPLISSGTIKRLLDEHVTLGRDISLLAVDIENPTGYGRILLDDNQNVSGIIEETDATSEQKKIKTINAGIYCAKKSFLVNSLKKINRHTAQGEMYLTDIIGIGYKEGKKIGAMITEDVNEVIGVNTCDDLQKAEMIMRNKTGMGKIS